MIIRGQTYKGVDDGRANILVPIDEPSVSLEVLAERRRSIERIGFMADHPLGSAAYDLALLAKASARTRDVALTVGGLVDAAMMGAAPRGAPVRSRAQAPRAQSVPPTLRRPDARFGELNENGQATGVTATLTKPMLGTGSKARRDPPGLSGDGDLIKPARGHLLGRQLGGTGRDLRNLVALTQVGANTPQMSSFEHGLARRVRSGEVVEYSAIPLYKEGVLPPSSVLLTAFGSRGAPTARVVFNPAGRPK